MFYTVFLNFCNNRNVFLNSAGIVTPVRFGQNETKTLSLMVVLF